MFNSLLSISSLIKRSRSLFSISILALFVIGLSGCDSEPPKLMKAVKQFSSDEIRDAHVIDMRKNHMNELLHKRDETLYKGIRTEMHSLKACINCHVPEKHNGEILRHTNPEHFCSTCHGYVAQELDCFQCHVDHPVNSDGTTARLPKDAIHNQKMVEESVSDGNKLATNANLDKVEKNITNTAETGESTSE